MNWVVIPARQATQPGGIGSLESILGLLKSLKIRALDLHIQRQFLEFSTVTPVGRILKLKCGHLW
jgi:hypothetical protein